MSEPALGTVQLVPALQVTVYNYLPLYWYFIKQETYKNCDKSLMAMLCSFEVLSCICILKIARVAGDGSRVSLLTDACKEGYFFFFFLLY